MLGDNDAVATIAVKSVDATRKFYSEVLRLAPGESREDRGKAAWFKDPDGNILAIVSR